MGGIEINHTVGDDPVVCVYKFLKKFTSAKIIVIIDPLSGKQVLYLEW